MEDNLDSSPQQLARFKDEIQCAVKMYNELQTQIVAVLKPLQVQWASVPAVLGPAPYPLAKDWNSIREQWVEQAAAVQQSLQFAANKWAAMWAESQAALAKDLLEFGPRLRRTLEHVDHVGRRGWTVTMNMTPPDMLALSKMDSAAEANTYMLEWYDEADPDLTDLEQRVLMHELETFHTSLAQCFMAYRRGEYAISVPCLAAVFERGIRSLAPPEHFFSTRVEGMIKDRYGQVKQGRLHKIEVYFWMSLHAFVQWFYEQYGPSKLGEGRIFRHGIQHGTQAPPNEKVEALRLFHALDTVSDLYRRSRPEPSAD